MRTVRCTLVGGPYCGEPWDFPMDAPLVRITIPGCPLAGAEIYIRTGQRDAENRQIYQIRPRCLMRQPKQNHFPGH